MRHPDKVRLAAGTLDSDSHRPDSELQRRIDARRIERDLAATCERPCGADRRMPGHLNFATRREDSHASHARRFGWHHERRFAEVHLMRQLLHLARAERSPVGENRELVAAERARSEDVDENEGSFPGHPEIVPRRRARANPGSKKKSGDPLKIAASTIRKVARLLADDEHAAGGAATADIQHREFLRAFDLVVARAMRDLPMAIEHLAHPRRVDRMTRANQAAARIDRELAANIA